MRPRTLACAAGLLAAALLIPGLASGKSRPRALARPIGGHGGGEASPAPLLPAQGDTLYFDDIETVKPWTTVAVGNLWHRTTFNPHEGTRCWWAGDSVAAYDGGWGYGNYALSLLRTPVLDLRSASAARVRWWHRYDVEQDFDYCFVRVSTDTARTWDEVAAFTGTQLSYRADSVNLAGYLGETVIIEFRFSADESWSDEDGLNPTEGAWFLDDMQVLRDGVPILIDDGGDTQSGLAVVGTADLWHRQTQVSASPVTAWYCGDSASTLYGADLRNALVAPPLDFTEVTAARCDFQTRFGLVAGFADFWAIEASADGGMTWDGVAFSKRFGVGPFIFGGTTEGEFVPFQGTFICDQNTDSACVTPDTIVVDLSLYAGLDQVLLRILLFANEDRFVSAGMYLDDFLLVGSGIIVGIGDSPGPNARLPRALALGAPHPNPFNPSVTIPLSVPAGEGQVSLRVYDLRGRRVRTLFSGPLSPGEHRWTWDARDEAGQGLSSGLYVVRAEGAAGAVARKIILLK